MANIEFEPIEGEPSLVTCSACPGFPILGEMEYEHLQWHQRKGDPVDLSHLGGHNDPGPMPEDTR